MGRWGVGVVWEVTRNVHPQLSDWLIGRDMSKLDTPVEQGLYHTNGIQQVAVIAMVQIRANSLCSLKGQKIPKILY